MSDYSFLRSGQTVGPADPHDPWTDRLVALMAVFAEDAVGTAGRYALARGRRVVTPDDMVRALRYQARMFFQDNDATTLEARCTESLEHLNDSNSADDDHGAGVAKSDDSGSTGCDDDDDDDDGDDTDTDTDDDESVDEDSLEGTTTPEQHATLEALARRVDTIHETWHLFVPDDPLINRIKNAIDHATSTI